VLFAPAAEADQQDVHLTSVSSYAGPTGTDRHVAMSNIGAPVSTLPR